MFKHFLWNLFSFHPQKAILSCNTIGVPTGIGFDFVLKHMCDILKYKM